MQGESHLFFIAIVVLCALVAIGLLKILEGPRHRHAARYPQLLMPPTMSLADTARDAREAPSGETAGRTIESRDSFSIGSRFQDRYGIVGELGAGAFGNVCLAEDKATGHRVAIRLLPRWLASAPDSAHAVQRMGQAMVATSTAHPGLVRVLEFGETEDEQLFAAMELVEGRRLSEILEEEKALEVGVALRLALELGGPVEALHGMGDTKTMGETQTLEQRQAFGGIVDRLVQLNRAADEIARGLRAKR